jgi:hypothetical protein
MIKIKGHSNFEVKIIKYNNKYLIEKSSDLKNADRLQRQIDKQILLYNENFLDNVNVPKVIKKIKSEFKIFYIMEYISFSENVIDFIYKGNCLKINWFYNQLINIVESYFRRCEIKRVNYKLLFNKLHSIQRNITNNKLIKADELKLVFNYLYENMEYISNQKIPIGICHGDLTFSNILVDNNRMQLYLIDFLDSFIESPLLDIVKIRQDTKYLWTLNLYNHNYDRNKTIIILNYLDRMIDKYFQKYDFYVNCYKYFQIINLLRVLQYSKNQAIADNLLKCIFEIKLK